jgi:hypothetical protein
MHAFRYRDGKVRGEVGASSIETEGLNRGGDALEDAN